MAIERVNPDKCVGCKQCYQICYADVFRMDGETGKSVVTYPQDCAVCCWCIGICPAGAIEFTPVKTFPIFTSWG